MPIPKDNPAELEARLLDAVEALTRLKNQHEALVEVYGAAKHVSPEGRIGLMCAELSVAAGFAERVIAAVTA